MNVGQGGGGGGGAIEHNSTGRYIDRFLGSFQLEGRSGWDWDAYSSKNHRHHFTFRSSDVIRWKWGSLGLG